MTSMTDGKRESAMSEVSDLPNDTPLVYLTALEHERDALRADLARVTAERDALKDALTRQNEKTAQLEKERDAYRKDAERYRFIRSEEVATEPHFYGFWNEFEPKLCREERMDKLIDEHKV